MTTIEATERRLHIGGEWVDATGAGSFENRDPYSGEVVATVARGGREDARRARPRRRRSPPGPARRPPGALPARGGHPREPP